MTYKAFLFYSLLIAGIVIGGRGWRVVVDRELVLLVEDISGIRFLPPSKDLCLWFVSSLFFYAVLCYFLERKKVFPQKVRFYAYGSKKGIKEQELNIEKSKTAYYIEHITVNPFSGGCFTSPFFIFAERLFFQIVHIRINLLCFYAFKHFSCYVCFFYVFYV